jgi:DNA ligase (NAD+)
LLEAIESARTSRGFAQLLTGLGIPLVGSVAAHTIAERYRSIEAIVSLSEQALCAELADIHGIGPKIAGSVASYFADPKARAVLGKLISLGVVAKPPKRKTAAAKGPLQGSSFCITGVLSKPRQQVQELIRAAGGEVHDRVTQDTKYLVAGDKVGKTKLDAAQKRGVTLLSERDLEKMLRRLDSKE